ncbi:CinA family protein [Demetria terragena]|uniref:CinA family protein n=1 Tax=Demetria terragena TaxID=63959 RepID=UPI00035DEB81|nr:CinA family protein [Demetria terragena]
MNNPLPDRVVRALIVRGETVGMAESLTGGLVCAALTDISGASATVRGGIVAYATDVKADVLGVDAQVLRDGGAVQAQVAEQLAQGVRRVLACDWGLATTGVAGPTPQDGQPVGRVFIAVAGPQEMTVRALDLTGDRAEIREAAVEAVLNLLADKLGTESIR